MVDCKQTNEVCVHNPHIQPIECIIHMKILCNKPCSIHKHSAKGICMLNLRLECIQLNHVVLISLEHFGHFRMHTKWPWFYYWLDMLFPIPIPCLSQIITIVDMNWFQMFRNNMLIDELKRPWSLANANQWKQSFEKDILFQLRTEGWMTSSQSLRALCFIVIPPYVSHISVDKMPWICYVSSSPNSAGSDYAQKTKARPFHLLPKINGPFASIFMKKRLIVCACHTRISYFRLAERQISLCHNIK